MQWEFVIAIVIAIPIILFPAAFVWYVNIGGIYHAIQDARQKRKAAREEKGRVVAEAQQHITATVAREQPAEKELIETKHQSRSSLSAYRH